MKSLSCWQRWALLPPATTWVSPDTHALKPAQNRLHPYPSLAHFTLYPNMGCLGLKQLTADRRAPCSSHRLSLLTPCCPACQSARPPPRGKQKFWKPEMSSGEGSEIQPSVMGKETLGNCFLLLLLYQRNPGEGGISPKALGSHPVSPHQEGLPLWGFK